MWTGKVKNGHYLHLPCLFMLLATVISLLGLTAMSAYYTGLQTRDIAVRKVFGGTVASETGRPHQSGNRIEKRVVYLQY